MTTNLPDELVMEGVARAFERVMMSEAFVDRVADRILERMEILTPAEMAAVLGVSERRLGEVHRQWGLDKSTALGSTNPRYFLSQALARMRAKVVRGRRIEDAGALQAAQRQTPNIKLQTLNGAAAVAPARKGVVAA
jgi:hypothetical protein